MIVSSRSLQVSLWSARIYGFRALGVEAVRAGGHDSQIASSWFGVLVPTGTVRSNRYFCRHEPRLAGVEGRRQNYPNPKSLQSLKPIKAR